MQAASSSAPGVVRVGVSGWQYDGWRGDFYPHGLPVRRELAYVAERLDSVELNGPFYALQRPTTYSRWYDETPADFVFGVKGSRYLTHMKRLVDIDAGLANFLASGLLRLGAKLGPVLWQLPPRMRFDADVVRDFLDLLPATTTQASALAKRCRMPADRVDPDAHGRRPVRHAIEPRHRSFVDDRFFALLAEHDVCCVVSDSPAWPLLDETTTDFAYVRLHGHSELYASGYAARSLDAWADRCRSWSSEGQDVFVYFDNDSRGRAPHDAVALAGRLRGDGFRSA